ncbi:MAG: flagellar hook-associated protein FlgL [Clostridiales bacterium]|nr:flagellar hook-associated protein FlgL [Clostridiales bacterium]
MGSFISGRVTTAMLTNNYLAGMNRNLSNLQTINNQLTTGKEISRPSDNPYKVARTMQLYSSIDANKQYNENIKDTLNWLDTTDTALGQATTVLQRIRQLMVSAGNAAYGTKERESINNEVKERIGELGQILNTNFDGRYVFGGTKVASIPIDVNKNDVNGNILAYADNNGNRIGINADGSYKDSVGEPLNSQLGASLTTEVSQGVTIDYNVTAQSLLQFETGRYKNAAGEYVNSSDPGAIKETVNAMDLFKNIVRNLSSPDNLDSNGDGITNINEITTKNLSDMDKVIDNLLKIRAEVGAKQNRMESAQSQNEDSNYNMTDILSKTEDIDWTQKTIEYYMAKTVYQASLQVSAQVLPATLLDYL